MVEVPVPAAEHDVLLVFTEHGTFHLMEGLDLSPDVDKDVDK